MGVADGFHVADGSGERRRGDVRDVREGVVSGVTTRTRFLFETCSGRRCGGVFGALPLAITCVSLSLSFSLSPFRLSSFFLSSIYLSFGHFAESV